MGKKKTSKVVARTSGRRVEDFLTMVEGRSAATTAAYRSVVEAFLRSGQPTTVDGATRFVNGLRRRRAASTVNQALAAIRAAFVQAAEKAGLPTREVAVIRGALASIKAARLGPPDVAVVSPGERARLFDAMPDRVRLIAEVLYVTGARVSEVVNVRRDQIKVNGHVELRIVGKGDRERIAKIPADLYARVRSTFGDGPYLFTTSRGGAFHREYVSREIARAARRVLGRSVSAHVLRHSRATDLMASTHRIKAVSRLLGHASETTTLRYYVRDEFTTEELFSASDPEASPR